MMAFLTKPLGKIAVIAGFLALICLGLWATVSTVQSIIEDRVLAAEVARDAHWTAEIEKSNRIAAQNIIEQMRISRAVDLATRSEIDRLKSEISNLEKKNADLPDIAGSGIDLERTRLLNNRSITDYPN